MTFAIKHHDRKKKEEKKDNKNVDNREKQNKEKGKGKSKEENDSIKIEPAITINTSSVKPVNSNKIVLQHQVNNDIVHTECPAILADSVVVIDQANCVSKVIGHIQLEEPDKPMYIEKEKHKTPSQKITNEDPDFEDIEEAEDD
jgi:predicted transcriptional regulator